MTAKKTQAQKEDVETVSPEEEAPEKSSEEINESSQGDAEGEVDVVETPGGGKAAQSTEGRFTPEGLEVAGVGSEVGRQTGPEGNYPRAATI